jgi:hypothetical protein
VERIIELGLERAELGEELAAGPDGAEEDR